MSLLSDSINQLAGNILGGSNVSVSLRKSPIELRDNSPLATLEGDPYAFSSISYPRDVTYDMQNGHYMLFYINVQNKTKYNMIGQESGVRVNEKVQREDNEGNITIDPVSYGNLNASYSSGLVGSNGRGKIITDDNTDLSKGRKGTINTSDGADLRKGRISGFQNNLAATYKTTTRVTDSVALYLPPNVQDSTSATYNGFATGVVGLAAAGGANFLQAMRDEDFERASKSFVNVGKGLTMEAIKKSSAALVESLTDSEGSIELVNSAFGQATNPYMEVLFDQMALRGFTYNFTFAPRNKAETDQVQRIIQLFRFHMAPELKGANNRFLTLPSTFDIHYMYQMEDGVASENDFYNRIATCVLESCTVDYTPDGVKSFASGAPTQIKMSLTFKETELLTKDRINEGF